MEENVRKIVLLVEDVPEEQTLAKAALTTQGFKVAVAGNLQDALRIWKELGESISGIATDLHFPERSNEEGELFSDQSKPCGIAIVAEAARLALPVVVCSDIDHHFAGYLKVVVVALASFHPLKKIPFIMDGKNWERAAKELTELIELQKEI